MIINIRGTHGSGKSTIIKGLLERFNAREEQQDKRGRPLGYAMNVDCCDKPVYVIGSYRTQCGGCDAILPYSEIWPRIEHYAALGHILFEGALVSSSYGNIGRASVVYKNNFVFAFLNTPLSVCLSRIKARRETKGNFKPLDPRNTEGKYNRILRSIPKIQNEFKRRVVILDYRKATAQILGILVHAQD